MHPVVLEWGPLVIRWYGVMMAITVLTGVAMALRVGPRLGIPAQEIDRLTLPFVLLAFVGARLGYVVSHPAEFTSPVEILRVYHGGLTSHGAIAGGLRRCGGRRGAAGSRCGPWPTPPFGLCRSATSSCVSATS